MISSKHIWIVNPFDQLPNESDIPLRFWSLSKSLADRGYNVIWWSSDFSHKHKRVRSDCADKDGFSIRLIKTPAYKKNISLSRIRSHLAFSKNFYNEAINNLKINKLEKPFRIIISLPPLGVAESAFKIKDYINKLEKKESHNFKLSPKVTCQVIVDIMDAWPEVFYRVFPKKIKNFIAPILLYLFHRSAMTAYKRADKISAVGESYLEIARAYLNTQNHIFPSIPKKGNHKTYDLKKPMHLCYHGVNLKRFDSKIILKRSEKYDKLNKEIKLYHAKNINAIYQKNSYLQIVYIGAMNSGYDLQSVVSAAAKWNNEGSIPIQIHFAGEGESLNSLKLRSDKIGLSEIFDNNVQKSKIIFHGNLENEEINKLLHASDIGLVTNRSNTLVACPYKAGEYAGAGLPMISCLDGEFNQLLHSWNAGITYESNNVQSLYNAIEKYSKDFELLKKHGINVREMAKYLFDREKTYKNFSKFILNDI